MNKRNIPKVRFKQFCDFWKTYKLGNLGSVAMNKRIFKEETSEVGEIPFYKIGTFGIEPDSFITREKFEEYKSKYPYPEIGDILISASGSIGRTVVYQGEEAYFQDSNIVWLKHDERLDNSFLKQFYSIVKWQGIEGTTIKRLYNKNILETPIALPSISEQSAIGSLFRTLDDLLTSYKVNLANYQSLKATMLFKMFPKAGQTVPEIRLDGFEGEWERTDLNKATDRVRSYSLSRDVETNQETGLKYVHYGDIHLGKVSRIDDGHLIPYIKSDTRLNEFLQRGDLIFADASEDYKGIAEVAVLASELPEAIVAGLHTIAVRPKSSFDSIFLFYMFKTQTFRRYGYKVGTGMKVFGISPSNLMKYEFYYPDKKEQQAVGAYFSNLDNLINSYQEKITQLETLKKKLLQDMFI